MLRRSALLLALAALVVGLGIVTSLPASRQVLAGPPPAVTLRDAAAVREAGAGIGLVTRSVNGVGILEPQPVAEAVPPRSLAGSPDGAALAFSPAGNGQVGPLAIARADGSQLEIAIPGVSGAAFEPAGAWLAVVDLSGGLWRVEAATGVATRLATGPFEPEVTVTADGRVLAIRVSSVEAPIWAAAEWVDAVTGSSVAVSAAQGAEEQLVYRATALLDGTVALVRHRTGGGVDITRVGLDGQESTIGASSHPGANISPGGEHLSWTESGAAWLESVGGGSPRLSLGPAAAASFSADGSLLMTINTQGARVFDLAGSRLEDSIATACWLGGGRGCRP